MPEKMNYHLMDSIAKENSGQRQSGKKVIDYYGFCTYNNTNSKPLLGMIYQEGGKIVTVCRPSVSGMAEQ